jgi:RNA polymerase sigma-70 factor, ECF subfamily
MTSTLTDFGTGIEEPSEDGVLVAQVLGGDRESFAKLMRRYNQRLFRVVRAIVRTDPEAEDVVQQAYVSAYLHLRQFEGNARFSTWLTRIAINEALARVRNAKRAADLESVQQSFQPPHVHSPEEQVSTRQLGRILEEAIEGLPESYRVVVVLREVEGLTTTETAACLGLSEEAVRVRIHRARALLRGALYERVGASASEVFAFAGGRCDRMVSNVLAHIRTLSI